MARTWSNAKKPADGLSAAQRARLARPSRWSPFTVGMILVAIFFLGLTFYATYVSLRHPLTESAQADNR